MKSFHGDPKIKEKYLARVKAHLQADEIVKGTYWEDGKGCAVGCTIHGDDHYAYERELGIPIQLAHLQDWIFENSPNNEAKNFPVDFLESIPVGANLGLVLPRFFHWLLVDPENGVIQYVQDEGEEQIKDSILFVANLYGRVIKGQEVKNGQWDTARYAAWDINGGAVAAAANAAWAAAAAFDAWGAGGDAEDAECSVTHLLAFACPMPTTWCAAYAASSAASGDTAKAAAWYVRAARKSAYKASAEGAEIKSQKEKLLELLAGVGEESFPEWIQP